MLNFGGAKMSKSLGNIEKVHDLLQQHPPEALRYALLSAHYRQPLDWSEALVEQSKNTLDRLYGTLRSLAHVPAESTIPDAIEEALEDDLNTPLALSVIANLAAKARIAVAPPGGPNYPLEGDKLEELSALKAQLLGAGRVLGLLQQDPAEWFGRGTSSDDDARIQALIDERAAAKKSRDFARSDAIRDQLAAEGILLEDTPQGVRWKRA